MTQWTGPLKNWYPMQKPKEVHSDACTCDACLNADRAGLCSCGSGLAKEAEYDAQGIFLCYACDKCRKEKLSGYRPEILTGYNQGDVDEPIDEDV